MTRSILASLLFGIFMTACSPFVEVLEVKKVPQEERLAAKEVRILEPEEARRTAWESITPLEATSCKFLITDGPATLSDALEQLKIKALRAGANALTGLSCNREGTSLGTNCWQSVSCTATAVRVDKNASTKRVGTERNPSSATGIFISAEGHVLTNSHAVNQCAIMEVGYDGQNYAAQLVAKDARNDLAVIRVDRTPESMALFRSSGSIALGESVVVAGYPLQGLLSSDMSATAGLVSSTRGVGNDFRFIQITAPVQPGNSGGPILDKHGNLIGIVFAKLDAVAVAGLTGSLSENVNFGIKHSIAKLFLEENGVPFSEDTSEIELSIPEIAERARQFTARVLCR